MLKIKNFFALIIFFIFIIIIIFTGILVYNHELKDDLTSQSCETLTEILEQQRFNFKLGLNAEIQLVESLAAIISYDAIVFETNEIKTTQLLQEIVAKTNFDFITIANTKGEGLVSDGRRIDVSERAHFQRALEGETVLPEPTNSLLRDESIVPLTAPIKKDGEVVGVIIASHLAEEFNKLILPSYEGKGYVFVVNAQGRIIAKSQNDYTITQTENLFDSWAKNNADFYGNDSFEDIMNNIELRQDSHTKYEINGQKRLSHYGSLGINDWVIFITVPEEVILEKAMRITQRTWLLTGVVFASFVLFILFIFSIENKAAKSQLVYSKTLERIAYVDELTGERSFNKFKEDAQRILEEAQHIPYVLVKMDIENFKLINKSFGFDMGDHILKAVSNAIKAMLEPEQEIFARISVDEYVILHKYHGRERLEDIKNNFVKQFYELMGKDFSYNIKFKMGQYVVKREQAQRADIVELFEYVNFAHRKAKQSMDLDVVFYDEKLTLDALRQKDIENRMLKALMEEEFLVYLQPKYSLESETIGGVEALVRWQTNDGIFFYPNDFIPIFEKNGFIIQLDFYMLRKACQIISDWLGEGLIPVVISVNFSRHHLNNKNFIAELCDVVDSFGIERRWIEIELTETAIYENLEVLEDMLVSLHEVGFTMSMDDFGSGYSSLGLLKNLPVDVIKIDRSFFVKQKDEQRSKTVVGSVMAMAKNLKIHTVAEGVEEKKHIDLLRELGCDMVQGYYFSKPMPANEFSSMLKNRKL